VNRLTIRQQDHTKNPVTDLGNPNPTSNSTIGLSVLANWFPNRPLDPFVSDHGSIGAHPNPWKYALVFTDSPYQNDPRPPIGRKILEGHRA